MKRSERVPGARSDSRLVLFPFAPNGVRLIRKALKAGSVLDSCILNGIYIVIPAYAEIQPLIGNIKSWIASRWILAKRGRLVEDDDFL